MRASVAGSPVAISASPPLQVTVSVGAAVGTVADFKTVAVQADAALYRTKAAGRNQVALA